MRTTFFQKGGVLVAMALTLEQKIGQTMMFGFHGVEPSEEILRLIRERQVGGVILFARNVTGPQQVRRLTLALQKAAYEAGHPVPLLISVDQENGVVRRFGQGTTLLPGNMAIGATGDAKYAKEVARATARELKALGVNFNLAPVLDVNNNPANPVIGVRSFGEDAEWVAACGVQAIAGYQAEGMATCGKHFPGHGDTHADSHLTLPTIPHGRERLHEVELVPFRAAIAGGVDAVMIAHVCFPAIEPEVTRPATMSHKVIGELLRGELGYQGVITTDCMEMKAIADTIGTVEGTYQALKAGVDLCCVSHTHEWQHGVIDRVKEGLSSGDLPMERLEEAAMRVLALKEKYLSWAEIVPLFGAEEFALDVVGCPAHEALAREVYERAVTLTKDDGVLPLAVTPEDRVGVVSLQNLIASLVEDDRYLVNPLAKAVRELHGNVEWVELQNPPTEEEIERVVRELVGCKAIVVGTMNAHLSAGQVELVERLRGLQAPVIAVSIRTPYDVVKFPEVAAHIATYEFTPMAVQVAVEAIFGKVKLTGRLPVTLPGVAERGIRA
jgi:beta-N-acetylhexosaminidase